MKDFKAKNIIYIVNLILLFIAVVYFESQHNHLQIIVNAFIIVLLVFINLILSASFYLANKNLIAKYFLLSSGFVLLIGFSSCFAVEYFKG